MELVSNVRRLLLLVAGFVSLGLGALGVIVPLLPTTPLVILAAACFAKSSPRMHQRLLDHRLFGPLIRDWQEHRCISPKAKFAAVAMIALVGGSTVVFVIEPVWLRLGVAAILGSVVIWLVRHPSHPGVATT